MPTDWKLSRKLLAIMKIFSCFLFVLFAAATAEVDDSKQCFIPKLYSELGCKPIYDDNPDCPSRFDCGLLSTRSSAQCYYKGVGYKRGELMTHDPDVSCAVGCVCVDDYRGGSSWSCAVVDCFNLMVPPPQDEVCYLENSFDSCCANRRCYPQGVDIKTLPVAKCEYNGKTYLEGENIETDLPCSSCICQRGFNGKLEEPFCRTISCGIEIYSSNDIRAGCVPVYYGTRCCPTEYRCPAEEESVIMSSSGNANDAGYKCTFGDLTLNIGDKLSPGNEKCIECTCSLPPYVTCSRKTYDQCQ